MFKFWAFLGGKSQLCWYRFGWENSRLRMLFSATLQELKSLLPWPRGKNCPQESKLAVNGLGCAVWRAHFFSIKTFHSFRGLALNTMGSSVILQLINAYYSSLLYGRNILCLFYISRHTVCLDSPTLFPQACSIFITYLQVPCFFALQGCLP